MKTMIDDKKCPQKGEIWLVDYSYKYNSEINDDSLEVEPNVKEASSIFNN